jgi:para-aminobenzoate synthetase component 1
MHYLRFCDDEMKSDFEEIIQSAVYTDLTSEVVIQQRISKEEYVVKVEKMQEHIQRGDIYEANFCMEFFAQNAFINPLDVYQKLNAISEAPFSVYFKNDSQFLLSASPERYLKKTARIQ